ASKRRVGSAYICLEACSSPFTAFRKRSAHTVAKSPESMTLPSHHGLRQRPLRGDKKGSESKQAQQRTRRAKRKGLAFAQSSDHGCEEARQLEAVEQGADRGNGYTSGMRTRLTIREGRGVIVSVGGPALTYWLTPTEEELRSRYNPDLLKQSIEKREEREQEFDEFVTRLKEYSKSDKPIWIVVKEEEERRRKAALEAGRVQQREADARRDEIRREAGLGTK
ncbi:Assembly factor cbp-4, partial [Tolypocladium ophioglossoides CBS 100239]